MVWRELNTEVTGTTEGKISLFLVLVKLNGVLLDVRFFPRWESDAAPHKPQVLLALLIVERIQNFPESFHNLMLFSAILVLSHLLESVNVDLFVSYHLMFQVFV